MAAERSRQHVANATADAIHLLNDEQLRVFDGGGGGGGSGGGGGATAAQLRDDSLSPKVEGARDVEGTQTFGELHVDAVASHFCMGLLHGEKKWTIWRPADAAWLRPRFADGGDDPLFDGPGDGGAPAPYEATQEPGDLLFVPGGAPHRVANVAATVGVAANFVDATNRDRQGRKRVIQVRFNMSIPRARVLEKASALRGRSER